MAKSSLRLKLLIDTQAERVLFAEAGKDCVDFLFYILSLPIATVTALLKDRGMGGSLDNLYSSIENLNQSYLQPNQSKDVLLKPSLSLPYRLSVPLLNNGTSPPPRSYYTCGSTYSSSCQTHFSDDTRTVCPSCGRGMTKPISYVSPPAGKQGPSEGGFVKELVTYMVMDNLVVEPLSTISCITLLNRLKVKDVGSLEEKFVDLGMDEDEPRKEKHDREEETFQRRRRAKKDRVQWRRKARHEISEPQ